MPSWSSKSPGSLGAKSSMRLGALTLFCALSMKRAIISQHAIADDASLVLKGSISAPFYSPGRRLLFAHDGSTPASAARQLAHDGHASGGVSAGPLVFAAVADILIALFFFGFRAAREVHRRGSLLPPAEQGARRRSVVHTALDGLFGDNTGQVESSEIELGATGGMGRGGGSGGATSEPLSGSQQPPPVLSQGHQPHLWQAALALTTPTLALLMIHAPWAAFGVSFPAILLLLLWLLHRRRRLMGGSGLCAPKPGAARHGESRRGGLLGRIRRSCLYAFLATSRTTLRLALPASGHAASSSPMGRARARVRWQVPCVTLALVALIQAVYFVEAAALLSTGQYVLYDAALRAAGNGTGSTPQRAGRLAWWWSCFSAVYNLGVDATGANIFVLAVYGLPAEAAWGAVRTYGPALPLATLLYNVAPVAASSLGSSVLACAVAALVLTHASLNAHRWPASELPSLFALHLWLFLFAFPMSYLAGGVCIECHGIGALYGALGGMALAPAFSDAPLSGTPCAACGSPPAMRPEATGGAITADEQRRPLDAWRWGWAALGGISLLSAGLASSLASWPAGVAA